jgi:hypothetical protein
MIVPIVEGFVVGDNDWERDGGGVLIIEYLHIYKSNKCILIYL